MNRDATFWLAFIAGELLAIVFMLSIVLAKLAL